MPFGGFQTHVGTPKSSKSLDHDLVLMPMLTWGPPILIISLYIYIYIYLSIYLFNIVVCVVG